VPAQVHADHVVPLLFGHVHEHSIAQDSGVVDQNVEITERADRRVHHPLRPLPVGHVVVVRDGLAARRRDLGDDLLGRRRVAPTAIRRAAEVVHDDLGPFGGKEQRVLAADATRRTGDDGDASVECSHCRLLSCLVKNPSLVGGF
jgi:hypothetical protein